MPDPHIATDGYDRPVVGVSSIPGSPVDDHTYNVLQALTSSLEAIEAYGVYQEDDAGDLFSGLLAEEQRRADRLLRELRSLLAR